MDTRGKVKEVIQRMVRGEPGLHVKRIEDYIIIRKGMPKMLAKSIQSDLKKGKYRKIGTHHNVAIFKRSP